MSPKNRRRKAPPGMPPAMAKALNLKQPGAPRSNPVPARERNPLQYVLQRGSEGKGVILSGPEALKLATAYMDSQNWLRQLNINIAELENANLRINQVWVESGIEDFYDNEDYRLSTDEVEAFDELRELVNPLEDLDEEEDA